MKDTLRVALAQLDLVVGDVVGNARRVLEAAQRAQREHRADLIAFPELTLSGYPPEDLLFHNGFRRRIDEAIERVRDGARGIAVLIGFPEYALGGIYNAAALYRDGECLAHYRKQALPNYGVFDEKRYFVAGTEPCTVALDGIELGITICEDLWEAGPMERTAAAGARAVLNINASPFDTHNQVARMEIARRRTRAAGVPLLYVNLVGGQDELVFDGASFVLDRGGALVQHGAFMTEDLLLCELHARDGRLVPLPATITPQPDTDEMVYRALVLGVRDYIGKHNFPGVVIGLSGGVDSALTLAIAVDAIGAERVQAVLMPSRYTSSMSIEDAIAQARALGVRHDTISIESVFSAVLDALSRQFDGLAPDATEENIQARCRGMLLMAISNKSGRIVLTTGNKSEMAVGYATLYGDMAGGFAPIKDCSKTLVYRLARHRNAQGAVIPERVLTRAPTAELRHDQKDSDSLPPYDVLDPILEAFIEEDLAVDEIVARGFERATVIRVLDMVRRAEYKRRQAPPGVRVSRRAFGRDWRYPITSGYRTEV
jgi:NAD+ synthase (glutamine-hydrolysing)